MEESNIQVIEFGAYQAPKQEINLSSPIILNGYNNEYFHYIRECYSNSPTNSAIINGISNYIVGEGLIDSSNGSSVNKYISKQDFRLIVQDYKTYGGCAIQIIWNKAYDKVDKKPVAIKYLPIFKVGLNVNDEMEVNGYWYSFDWVSGRFEPKFYHKFDGSYKEEDPEIDTDRDIEILVIQRPSSNDFFANPDYQSGLPYAQLEAELANSAISHVQNGFQGGAIINANNGVPPTEELKKEYRDKIVRKLTGTNNTNKLIVSFNENPEQAMTIDRIDVAERNDQYESFDKTAEEKLIVAHSVPPILFEGNRSGGGFSSNAEEIQTATQSLYRKVVHPAREVILGGLQSVFNYINSGIILDVKDFDSFVEEDADNTEE